MKSWEDFREFALERMKNPKCLDGRDTYRIMNWLPYEDIKKWLKKPDPKEWEQKPYTREAIVEQLIKDATFGQEKADNERGISSSLMYNVVQMWLEVLEEYGPSTYAPYGTPLFDYVLDKYKKDVKK